MSFEVKIQDHHVVEFAAKADLAYQQRASKMRFVCDEKPCQGEESATFHEYGTIEAEDFEGRLQLNLDNPVTRRRRWIQYDSEFGQGEHLPEADKWRQAMDPQSKLMMTHTAAVSRRIDYEILKGILGTTYSGKTPTTAHTLGAGNTIDVAIGGAGSGLNIDKLIAVREAFGITDVDMEASMRPQAFITWRQMTDLLKIAELRQKDTGIDAETVQRTGKLMNYMGIDFTLVSPNVWRSKAEPAPNTFWKDSATRSVRYCPVVIPKSITLGVWQEVRGRIWNDSSKRNVPVMEVSANMHAARDREEAVLRVECTEASPA
jgi:hypothetical protein